MLHVGRRIKSSLFSGAYECIVCPGVDEKLHCVQELVQRWHLGHLSLEVVAVKDIPKAGLPENLKLVHPSKVPRRRIGSEAGRVALLHAIAHIEFSAINLALDAVYRFQDMPAAYYREWLRVASEECYHFVLIRHLLEKLDVRYGDLDAHQGLWDVARYSSDKVLKRMALVPRVLEARGLDVTPGIMKKVAEVGDHEFVEVLKIILRDEIGHVRIGTFWFNWLCDQEGIEPANTFSQILEQYQDDMNAHISGPFDLMARKLAGFSQQELDQLEKHI